MIEKITQIIKDKQEDARIELDRTNSDYWFGRWTMAREILRDIVKLYRR